MVQAIWLDSSKCLIVADIGDEAPADKYSKDGNDNKSTDAKKKCCCW